MRHTMSKMSTEEKVGQLFMVWARAEFLNVDSPEYLKLTNHIDRYHVGSFALTVPVDGPFLIKGQPYEAAMLVNRLQQQSKLPLLIAADFESGLSSRLNGTTVFPQAMAFGAGGKTRICRELRQNHRARSPRHRSALEFLSGGGRKFQSGQSHH